MSLSDNRKNIFEKRFCFKKCANLCFLFKNKVNFKGIQSIVGAFIVILLFVFLVCNSNKFNRIWNQHFGKSTPKQELERTKKKLEIKENENDVENQKEPTSTKGGILFSGETEENSKSYMNSFSKKLKMKYASFKEYLSHQNSSYVILSVLTIILTFVQIVFAHDIFSFGILERARNMTTIKDMCRLSAQYYMFEDLLYMPLSLLFLILLYFQLHSRRFNRYIMFKFRSYFKSEHYETILNENQRRFKEKRENQERLLKQEKCGGCRLWLHKLCSSNACPAKTFCCVCCCSCFVPTSSSTRCFLWYCCCAGWKQTDPYKIYRVSL
jgi:hypothetical protein